MLTLCGASLRPIRFFDRLSIKHSLHYLGIDHLNFLSECRPFIPRETKMRLSGALRVRASHAAFQAATVPR